MSQFDEQETRINYDEPPMTSPPILEVSVLAWIRRNLFRTWWDTALTLFGILFIIAVISSFVLWTVRDADWFVIMFNLRQFLLGRLELTAEWRAEAWIGLVALTAGVSLAAWTRSLSRILIIGVGVGIALLFVLPL